MSRTELLYGLPIFESGSNKGRLNRTAACLKFDLTSEELSKAYNNWIQVFRLNGSTLTLLQYLNKLTEANIRPHDVGNSIDQYHLSRYNDEGPYTQESCRFIQKKENLFEQKKASPYLRMLSKYGKEKTRQIQQEAGKKGRYKQLYGSLA